MTKFSDILVYVDERPETHLSLDFAADLAKRQHARIKVVSTIPDLSWPAKVLMTDYAQFIDNLTQAKAHALGKLTEPLVAAGLDVRSQVLEGPTSVALIREVLRDGHDLVIKLTKGQQSRRPGFFGTTATRLLRKCPCPVLLLKPGHPCHCERIVAAVTATAADDVHGELNHRIVELACSLGKGAELTVVSGWDVYGESILREHMSAEEFEDLRRRTEQHARRKLDELVADFKLEIGDRKILIHGDPPEVIAHAVEQKHADLLVLGTIARSGVAGLLMGNTAEQVLNRVTCSVLAVKPAGFVSPVHLA